MALYEPFHYVVRIDGREVAGFQEVRGLTAPGAVVQRDGGDTSSARKSPGRTKFEAITLERGVTYDPAFAGWAGTIRDPTAKPGDVRRDVALDLRNESGEVVLTYRIFRAWISEYQALPDLDANANAVAIEHLRLEHEGWELDSDTPAVQEEPRTRHVRVRLPAWIRRLFAGR